MSLKLAFFSQFALTQKFPFQYTPIKNKVEDDILKFLQAEGVDKGKITKWMLPVYVAFVDDIPKTSVGKYDKIAVRKRMEEFVSKAKKVRLA